MDKNADGRQSIVSERMIKFGNRSRKNVCFTIVLLAFVAGCFFLNKNHLIEQGIYQDRHVALAQNILNGHGYSYRADSNQPAFYPLWGYPLLVMLGLSVGHPGLVLLLIQGLLCIVAIKLFYKLFKLEYRYRHLILLLPFVVIMSAKIPDAIVDALLFFVFCYGVRYIEKGSLKALIPTALLMGVIGNFRSDYLFVPILILSFSILPHFRNYRRRVAILCGAITVATVVLLIPWSARSFLYDGQWRLTATNGGLVAYISLGQLPGNPWGIKHVDDDGWRYTARHGVNDPYSTEGEALLKGATIRLIKDHPGAYIIKVGHNLLRSLIGGVYTGEYANLTIEKERLNQIWVLTQQVGRWQGIKSVRFTEAGALAVNFMIAKIYCLIFIVLLVFWSKAFYIYRESSRKLLIGLGACFIFYKLLIVSFLQYQPRHMNAVYLMVLGAALVLWRERPRKDAG
ncbi:MAG: hypothetical protein P9M14_07905 [Candidatus Alcyoniella australis]|nr:hypothetical protein [Candidatus Alcyoniella australis]